MSPDAQRPVRIDHATDVTEASAAAVLAEAFADDPTIAALIPPHTHNRAHRLQQMFRAEMHTCGLEHVDVALGPDDEVLGTAVWGAPGRTARRSTAIRWTVISTRALGLRGTLAASRYERALRRLRPTTPHWHLLDIGTSDAARGQGVGSSLLRHRLAIVDTSGRPALLEATSEGSRRLYASHGFEDVGRLPEPLGGAWVMVRPPTA